MLKQTIARRFVDLAKLGCTGELLAVAGVLCNLAVMQSELRVHRAELFKKKPADLPSVVHRWQTPEADWTMINIDGAFSGTSGNRCWGCVAMDHESQPMFAVSATNAGDW